jgi:hypothetical protein
MRKDAFFPTVVWAIIAFNVPLRAEVVSLECDCDVGERYPALQTCSFDYGSQLLTTTDAIYEIDPADGRFGGEWLIIEGRHDSPSTITVVRNITNKTGFDWTGYMLTTTPSAVRSGWFVYGSATSSNLQTIAYPGGSPEFCPYIEFSGQGPVLVGESFTVQFDMFIPERGGFQNILEQNAIPEPTTITLLILGGLALLRKTRRMK